MANENCPMTAMEMGSRMEGLQEAVLYNDIKSFGGKMRRNDCASCSLEMQKNILKSKIALGVLDNDLESEPNFAGLTESMVTTKLNPHPKYYGPDGRTFYPKLVYS